MVTPDGSAFAGFNTKRMPWALHRGHAEAEEKLSVTSSKELLIVVAKLRDLYEQELEHSPGIKQLAPGLKQSEVWREEPLHCFDVASCHVLGKEEIGCRTPFTSCGKRFSFCRLKFSRVSLAGESVRTSKLLQKVGGSSILPAKHFTNNYWAYVQIWENMEDNPIPLGGVWGGSWYPHENSAAAK
eukprot:6417819-Amphidinium_carterae.1